MSLRKSLFVTCLIVSALCLAAGYAVAGRWIGAALAVLSAPAWLLAKKYAGSSLGTLCLLGSVALAVAGVLSGASPMLMILGSSLALAAWDLLSLDSSLGDGPLAAQTRLFESQHLRSLFVALGAGLLAASLGRLFTIQVPFLILILLVAFLFFALDRVLGGLKGTGRSGT